MHCNCADIQKIWPDSEICQKFCRSPGFGQICLKWLYLGLGLKTGASFVLFIGGSLGVLLTHHHHLWMKNVDACEMQHHFLSDPCECEVTFQRRKNDRYWMPPAACIFN